VTARAPRPRRRTIGADYGLTTLVGAPADRADRLASFILSVEGQAFLARHGFAGPISLSAWTAWSGSVPPPRWKRSP